MTCPQWFSIQAWLDDELDEERSQQARLHVSTCTECGTSLEAQRAIRKHLLETAGTLKAPPALQARVKQVIHDTENASRINQRRWRMPTFWLGAGTGGVCATLVIMLLSTLQIWLSKTSLVDTLVAEHSTSLTSGHLVSVESSEHHTVKPWFALHADVSPVVADFSESGFRLLGGRVETVQQQHAAVAVYSQGAHMINIFSWPSDVHPFTGEYSKRGFNLNCWTLKDVQYCAVSDVNRQALHALKQLLSTQPE